MAKKKKTQLKPVARGFATTSQPKKVVIEDTPESELAPIASDQAEPASKTPETQLSSSNSGSQTDNISAKERYLQGLVDRLQEKTEKEISRTLKSIEVDRRFSQTLPHLEIDPLLRNQLVALALQSYATEGQSQKFVEDSDEKTVARLGINYGILRRLGFSEDCVIECIKNINGIDLEEAFDWLYLHYPEELASERPDAMKHKIMKLSSGVTFHENCSAPGTPHTQQKPLHPLKTTNEESLPVSSGLSPEPGGQDGLVEDQSVALHEAVVDVEEVDNDAYDDDPTLAYVRLRLKIDEKSLNLDSNSDQEQLRHLRQRLNQVTQDYLFDEKDALTKYKTEREKLDKLLLHDRLRGKALQVKSPSIQVTERSKVPPNPPTTKNGTALGEEDDSDSSSTGIFGILENPDTNEITVKGVTYSLRDMSIPKHWSGMMPKTMLRDFVAKADRYAAISYTKISNHSRAKRASVSISWQNKERSEWVMDNIACNEDSHAEQYVAAVALHSLTYPITEGFIASSPSNTSGSTSFRLLPAVYRELWDELELSRKVRDDGINRQIWAILLSIIEDKVKYNPKPEEKQSKQLSEKIPSNILRNTTDIKDNYGQISLAFQARQATPLYQEMLSRRNELPIAQYRQQIVDILNSSQVLVLSGETGCGKSTQVPAFILEDHLAQGKPCKVYCTEPRRISAISLAQRVAYELCDPPNSVGTANSLVGYSIRLESNISRNTRLAYVTNGIALRMLEGGSGQGGNGMAFDEITHLIIDEVHERTIESDFLLIVLKSLLIERPDLKVILMSATLDAEKISAYFGNCQILQVPGRTFPVEVQFLEDAIECTKWTVTENSPYARRLHDKYYQGKNRPEWTEDLPSIDDDEDEDSTDNKNTILKLEKRYSPETAATLNTIDERIIPYDLIIRLLETICYDNPELREYSLASLIFMPGLGEIRRLNDALMEHKFFGSEEFRVYPLHSTLSSESQGAVFDVPPPGVRKIVIATNIAETGITIPDITCVIDTGKHREMRFDEKRQISRLVETFIARSNAAQRRGRAGRVQHGLCFHLFTKTRHETQMADSPLPEMMRLSLSDLALRIKIMKVKLGNSIEDVLSRALDPPVSINVQRAVSMLTEVRALTPSEEITPMGKLLSKLPTDVHLGKFLLISTLFRCLDPALTIAATLNSKSPFVAPFGLERDADRARNSFRTENSDFLTIHNAFSSWRTACAKPGFARKFCRTNFLSHQVWIRREHRGFVTSSLTLRQNLQQIEDLRQQFLGYLIDSSFIQVDRSLVRELGRSRFSRNRTRFVPVPPELNVNASKPALVHAALTAGLYPKILSIDSKNGHLRTITNNQHASFHPSSVNFGRNALDFGVHHLSYFTLMHSKKLYAWETAPVDDLSLLILCGEAEFKLVAGTVSIDRKIKLFLPPQTGVALKFLRDKLNSLLALQYQGKALKDAQIVWMETGLLALSRIKVVADKDEMAIGIR